MTLEQFLTHYTLNAPQLMWFLGAGTSRSAGMPSATDIIWDLKRRHYCVKENRDITDNELSNEAIQKKIQTYLESSGCPPIWSEEEYSFYFKLVFGDEPALHQRYLEEKLHPELISINSGHKVLAALMAMQKAKLVFTTNFDNVIEDSYAYMTGNNLHSYNLEGSYAALNALNNESFPIYAKVHGDFRYFEMKNLPEQLQSNDKEIEKAFINACSRYGLIVCGYSGRDQNVMEAFNKAVENDNAFPKGLFWITSVQGHVFPVVSFLIEKAKAKGINAHIVQADTFDSLMGTIWKQMIPKNDEYDRKIRRAVFEIPNIARHPDSSSYPLLRLNAFPILSMPKTSFAIQTKVPLSVPDFVERARQASSSAITVKEKNILYWGSDSDIHKIISPEEIANVENQDMEEYLVNYNNNALINSFYSKALTKALVRKKAIVLRKRHGRTYAVISSLHEKYSEIGPILKDALKAYNFQTKQEIPPNSLVGRVPGVENTFWMECVEINLESFDGKFYLTLVPDIWIEPGMNRKLCKDFLTEKKKARYNKTQNRMLDAWKQILIGNEDKVILRSFHESIVNNAEFEISTKTMYSFKLL